ncbi:hypothetical protein BLNAU_3784 [Blattamonas nauphoetae]|uniref:Uncharacterized protein n=1 Tax=Blattamonas nauphoetae TaxID=2049346 RepID=A0ABQ9YC44_9EUKA|nr:hypothetical protein BLNAU_3784 [Blattamonas nauphoetae]
MTKPIYCFICDGSEQYFQMTINAIASLNRSNPTAAIGVIVPSFANFEDVKGKVTQSLPQISGIRFQNATPYFENWNPTQYKLALTSFKDSFDPICWVDSDACVMKDLSPTVNNFVQSGLQYAFLSDHVNNDPRFLENWEGGKETCFVPQACFMMFRSASIEQFFSLWQKKWKEWIEPTPFANHKDPAPYFPGSTFCIEQYALGQTLMEILKNDTSKVFIINRAQMFIDPAIIQNDNTVVISPRNADSAAGNAQGVSGSNGGNVEGGLASLTISSYPSSLGLMGSYGSSALSSYAGSYNFSTSANTSYSTSLTFNTSYQGLLLTSANQSTSYTINTSLGGGVLTSYGQSGLTSYGLSGLTSYSTSAALLGMTSYTTSGALGSSAQFSTSYSTSGLTFSTSYNSSYAGSSLTSAGYLNSTGASTPAENQNGLFTATFPLVSLGAISINKDASPASAVNAVSFSAPTQPVELYATDRRDVYVVAQPNSETKSDNNFFMMDVIADGAIAHFYNANAKPAGEFISQFGVSLTQKLDQDRAQKGAH